MSKGKSALRLFIAIGIFTFLGCSGAASTPSNPSTQSTTFLLTSDAGVDGGTLPAEYTCDGSGVSPALSWSNAPSGTKEFALLVTTLPGDGTTKWNWVLYSIPVSTTSLAKGSSGVGISGVGSNGPAMGYQPPCSQGSGTKLYTFTLYALSASPQLSGTAGQVTGAALTQAISSITLGSASMTLGYARTPGTSSTPSFTMAETISDGGQRTTLAFAGLAMMTGNLDAQSFFPPGKVADYTGFQYLRDNDPDNMGHNTSFLTRVANNIIYILSDSQLSQLKAIATAQQDQINQYGYKRFAVMKAFRRLLDGNIPAGSSGLNLDAVKKVSRELYILDGQISFDRALLYANILNSLDSTQKAYLAAMKGKGWRSWPNITDDQIKTKMQGLPQGTAVAVMTYAGDLFSWYAGSLDADVYFCPERHGTYFGSFYIKDAPAIGHEGYSIDEQLTATAGSALCDSSKGYVTDNQAAVMSSLVDTQRNNLYAGASSIVSVRTQIATLLRSLLISTASSDTVKAQVLTLSGIYGDLDGENNYNYAIVFGQVYKTLTTEQKAKLAALRKSIMSGTYADGASFDYSVCTTPFLYSSVITDVNLIAPYITNTDYLFFEP
ncbi:MAG: hypothetical protein CSYNP_02280 [Syntrophus sp. SKADARSKE-3]|nr:hypothetical protein [Syntrophus sp. SKADARSKE-3]